MSVVSITAWCCDFPACGHVWYTAKEPARCSKCKRKNWNKTAGTVIKPPRKRKKKAGKGTAKAQPVSNPSIAIPEVSLEPVMEDLGVTEPEPVVVEPEKPLPAVVTPEPVAEPVLPTIVRQPTAAKYREILKSLTNPDHKIGQKCPHGWSNWLQCPKCNQKVG